MTEYKVCIECKQSLPMSEFRKSSRESDGYRPLCKGCTKERRKAFRDYGLKFARKADQLLIENLKLFVAKYSALKPTTDVPNVGELAMMGLAVHGGLDGIMFRHACEMLAAEPGSLTRQRYVQDLHKLLMKADEMGYAKRPLSMYTLEELEEAVANLMTDQNSGVAKRMLRIAEQDGEETQDRIAV